MDRGRGTCICRPGRKMRLFSLDHCKRAQKNAWIQLLRSIYTPFGNWLPFPKGLGPVALRHTLSSVLPKFLFGFLCFLVKVPRSLAVLSISSKNQLLVLLFFSIASLILITLICVLYLDYFQLIALCLSFFSQTYLKNCLPKELSINAFNL